MHLARNAGNHRPCTCLRFSTFLMAKIQKTIGFDTFSQFSMTFGSVPAPNIGISRKCQFPNTVLAGADPKTIEKLRKNVKTNFFLILAVRKTIMNKHVQGRWFPVFLARCKLAHKCSHRNLRMPADVHGSPGFL